MLQFVAFNSFLAASVGVFVWWFLRFVFLNFEHCFPQGAAFSAHLWIRGKGVEFPGSNGE